MTAIILAGGRAKRMQGKDKAFLKIGKYALINRQLILLKKIFKKIIIVTNSPKKYRHFKGIKIVTDIFPHNGPLGGIFSGLTASGDDYNFVLACDMPFINQALMRYMIAHKDNYDILIPKVNGKFHPLLGIYSKNCLPAIEAMLKDGRLKIANIFPKVKTRFILKKTLEKFDPQQLSLININTQEDLAKARSR